MFNGSSKENQGQMLGEIGITSVEELFKDIPSSLKTAKFNLPNALDEQSLTKHIKELASKNKPLLNFAGAGIYEHFIPAVVNAISSRGEFLTAYTPYQAQASQGTLQAIYEYQSSICALMDMEVSNASHYDGATALAEAVYSACQIKGLSNVLISAGLNPQYKQVLKTYFKGTREIKFTEVSLNNGTLDLEDLKTKLQTPRAAFVLATPNFFGCLEEASKISQIVHNANALLISVVNPISLGILETPGFYDSDFAVAEGQCLGNAMSFGGPGLGIFTCKKQYVRYMPGRLCGITKDDKGNRCFVLTLQAREQHIRRERAASNICSNQALCALNALIYLSLLGPKGVKEVASLNLEKAHNLAKEISKIDGFSIKYQKPFFNEFVINCPIPAKQVISKLAKKGILAGYDLGQVDKDLKNCLLICVTETKTEADIEKFVSCLRGI
ncbi:MAG: aminomethyl-transferring glycine dehydrogenase subunit GcvPA [Elusimicrobiaceae bacterium]|nr:aminomethyl-transferring glycine dehydrogenase subunit GcvPA [Elusimicrobiaceae bacterium]